VPNTPNQFSILFTGLLARFTGPVYWPGLLDRFTGPVYWPDLFYRSDLLLDPVRLLCESNLGKEFTKPDKSAINRIVQDLHARSIR